MKRSRYHAQMLSGLAMCIGGGVLIGLSMVAFNFYVTVGIMCMAVLAIGLRMFSD